MFKYMYFKNDTKYTGSGRFYGIVFAKFLLFDLYSMDLIFLTPLDVRNVFEAFFVSYRIPFKFCVDWSESRSRSNFHFADKICQ